MRSSARVVAGVGRAARAHRRDDLHDAAGVVEGDDDVGHHEREVRHAELVDRRAAAPARTSVAVS